MPDQSAPRPAITMIWTRKLDGESMAGRLRIAQAIRSALSDWADLTLVRLPTPLTDRSIRRAARSALAWLSSFVKGPILPLQCALFASATDHERVCAAIPNAVTSIYLDGVRSYALLVRLRRERPDLRIVVDLDDLMSRRMELLLKSGQPLSPGYLTKHLPGMVKTLVMSRGLGALIVRFELNTLRVIERRLAALADALVLLSSEDAQVLRQLCEGQPQRASIEVIAPGVEAVAAPQPLSSPARFVFIGSDALTQNRLTIDYLLDLWRRHAIETPLVLFGLQGRALDLPPAVSMAGYVDQIADVYDGHSVLLTPSMIGGGLKTKVLEAFAYGAPVIGNPLTFESMPIEDYPLNFSDEAALVELLRQPQTHQALFDTAAAAGAAYLAAHHSPEVFTARWRRIMAPQTVEAEEAASLRLEGRA